LGGLAAVAAITPLVWFGALALLRHDLMTEIRALPFVSSLVDRALRHLPERGKH
jgi:hypothetical protein